MSFFAEQGMDLVGCTQTCKDYCQPVVDELLKSGYIHLYLVLCLLVIVIVLAWNVYYYKKLYYDEKNERLK